MISSFTIIIHLVFCLHSLPQHTKDVHKFCSFVSGENALFIQILNITTMANRQIFLAFFVVSVDVVVFVVIITVTITLYRFGK